jgi:Uncharacterized conserved protein
MTGILKGLAFVFAGLPVIAVNSSVGATTLMSPAIQTCTATTSSITPAGWTVQQKPSAPHPTGLVESASIPLPGPANRFDYQSIDAASARLYMSHMNAGTLVVFDLDAGKVAADVPGVDRATGVLSVPSQHRVYVSAAGRHELVAIDDHTLNITGRVGGIHFPDGIAYAPDEQKIFVSDESGKADVVISASSMTKRSTISLGGEAGNTHYDAVSHCILVAVQTTNELVAIDPASEKIVARYSLPGSDHPHGFAIDEPGRLAFITSEESATLQVVDLRTMKVLSAHPVGGGPDVVAWDAAWRGWLSPPSPVSLRYSRPMVRYCRKSLNTARLMHIRLQLIRALTGFICHSRMLADDQHCGF